MNTPLKTVAAIHDISCFGRCSLTVALPIISACGISCAVMPTAVLSTHTGGFQGFTKHDLTYDLLLIAQHWNTLELTFDALYSGFLGSTEQVAILGEIIDMNPKSLIMIDPVMGDNGKLYQTFDAHFPDHMRKLCTKADIITPNVTEASLLLNQTYHAGIHTRSEIKEMLHALAFIGENEKQVVLTGVCLHDKSIGAAVYDCGDITFHTKETLEGFYPGTGDVFASVLLSAYLSGKSLSASAALAVSFVHDCIKKTMQAQTDPRHGIIFEPALSGLAHKIHIN